MQNYIIANIRTKKKAFKKRAFYIFLIFRVLDIKMNVF